MGIDTYTVNHWNEATHVHEPSILTIEQNFTFDALGFVVLPQLLSQPSCPRAATAAMGWAISAARSAPSDATCASCAAMAFAKTVLRGTSLPPQQEYDETSLPLEGGAHTLDRAYINLAGWNGRNADGTPLTRAGGDWEEVRIRQCQGLMVAIALTDSAEGKCPLVVVPSSHKSGLPAPPLPSSSRFAERPALAAGDVLLCAASTLHGVCPQGDGGRATRGKFHLAHGSATGAT